LITLLIIHQILVNLAKRFTCFNQPANLSIKFLSLSISNLTHYACLRYFFFWDSHHQVVVA